MSSGDTLRLGLDVGSTTVKAVYSLDGNRVVFSDYRRHNADDAGATSPTGGHLRPVRGRAHHRRAYRFGRTLSCQDDGHCLRPRSHREGAQGNPDAAQEVDVVIELGGEDAKITYLHPRPSSADSTCAGGTGAFIDQMATLLQTDRPDSTASTSRHKQLYPIASRVISPSQISSRSSIRVRRTKVLRLQSSLRLRHRPSRVWRMGDPFSTVMFLGGPLHFLPQLRAAYERLLPSAEGFVTPVLLSSTSPWVPRSADAATEAQSAQELVTLIDRLTTAHVIASPLGCGLSSQMMRKGRSSRPPRARRSSHPSDLSGSRTMLAGH